jgi:hypothetical protein
MYSSTTSSTLALEGMGGQCQTPEVLPPVNEPLTLTPGWTDVENLVPKGIRSSDRQVRSE